MKITFLGTGTSQGVPMIGCSCEVCRSLDYRDKRLRVSVLVEVDELRLVIDAGPDFRRQMLREHNSKLDAVLLTHSHKDHIAGLDEVRAFNFFQQSGMPIFGTAETLKQVAIEFYYAFEEQKYPGTPVMDLYPITSHIFEFQGVSILPLPVFHHRMPVMGFRIGDFSYITDANHIPEDTIEKLKGTKILVLNALQNEAHPSHFTLPEALVVAERVNAEQTFFTHISHRLGLHQVVSKELPPSRFLAFDGLRVTL